MKFLAGDARGEAPALEHIREILPADPSLVPAGTGAGRAFPTAAALQQDALEAHVQRVERNTLGRRTHLQRPGADQVVALVQLVDDDIQRRDLLRVHRGQGVRRVFIGQHSRIRCWQPHGLQVDHHRCGFGIGEAGVALDLLAVELQGPGGRFACQLHRCLVQRCAESAELADLDVQSTEQLLGITAWVLPGILVHQVLPRADIQLRQRATNAQALCVGQHGIAIAEEQLATAVGKIAGRCSKREVRQFTVVHPVAPLLALQGHAERGVAPGIRRQAKGRRMPGATPRSA
ncbi:hypothetical protein D9M71_539800 [compost metagenome]